MNGAIFVMRLMRIERLDKMRQDNETGAKKCDGQLKFCEELE